MRVESLLLVLLLLPSVIATGITNVPPLETRDVVLVPGFTREYSLPIFGANHLDALVSASPEIAEYVTIVDEAPATGPRTIIIRLAVPQDARIPAGIYGMSVQAIEKVDPSAPIATQVSVAIGWTLRVYSDDPLLDITAVTVPSIPVGETANVSVTLTSRSTVTIPATNLELAALHDGVSVASGRVSHGAMPPGETVTVQGSIDAGSLDGGVYPLSVRAVYGAKEAWFNKSVLRIGTLTIDMLDDYTKQFQFNQTNKFSFKLKSNWNKELANVLTSVTLLGQERRAPPERITSFGTTEPIEVYFDRDERAPGPLEGAVTVTYQELQDTLAAQERAETHSFSIPIYLDIVAPAPPIATERPFRITGAHILIGAAILLILINILIAFLLFRKRPEKERPQEPQEQQEPRERGPPQGP